MTDFAQALQNDHNNISGAVQQDRSFKDIKDLFDVHGTIYSINAFPSPIIHINPFSHKSKNTSSERVNLFCILGVSITRFLMRYFKMRIKMCYCIPSCFVSE